VKTRTTLFAVSLTLILLAAGAGAQSSGTDYGEPFTIDQITPLAKIIESPGDFVGKEVRTAGFVFQMCEDSGCWLGMLPSIDSSEMVKISFTQTAVRFPIGEETTSHYVEIQGEVITAEQEATEHEAHMIEEGEDPAARAEEHAEHVMHEMRTIYVCNGAPEAMSFSPGDCPTGGAMVAKEVPVPTFTSLAINGSGAVVKDKK